MDNIRNFAIIAHVDHGKSTLADRFLEITGTVEKGKHEEQLLDRNPISRERGITIKLAPVRMKWEVRSVKLENEVGGERSNPTSHFNDPASHLSHHISSYILNLIDTPGHVDFTYEVERTLACVEGVILLVDATQGIQAQTIAHGKKALAQNLVVIPAVNKIDLPQAQVEKTKREMANFLGIKDDQVYEVSAKTGQNVEQLLQAVIEKVPPPNVMGPVADFPPANARWKTARLREPFHPRHPSHFSRSLIFDSYYDQYRGVIAFVRIFEGQLKAELKVKLFATNTIFEILEVGVFTPDLKPTANLSTGEIGYVVTNLKDIHLVQVGDTIGDLSLTTPLPGYKKVKPMVFASMFTTDPHQYLNLKKALEKLSLNDSSLTYEAIYSQALGSGFRLGFLGLLHADVVRERLEREFGLSLILTSPQVEYKLASNTESWLEPMVHVAIITPQEYLGAVMKLCENARGKFLTMDNKSQIFLSYEMPLSELISNFFDQLKTITSGYASLDWQFKEYREADVDKLEVLLNNDPVEEFSEFVVAQRAFEGGRELTQRLRNLIPRQQYEVRVQAKYKGKIIASERIAPFRKDVTGKLYGGDRTRKDKLLERQKKGKKMMKNIGRVEIPKEVFLKLFRYKS